MVVKDDHNVFWITIILILSISLIGTVIFFNYDKIKDLYTDKKDDEPIISISFTNDKELEVSRNITDEEALVTNNYLEFSIDGKYNNGGISKYNIYFKNKQLNNNIKFYLTEVTPNGEIPVLNKMSKYLNGYQELDDLKLLYTDYFDFSKSVAYKRTYRLRAWVLSENDMQEEKISIDINTKDITNASECFIIEDSKITGYKCYKGNNYNMPVITDVIISNKINGSSITEVAESAFYNQEKKQGYGITSVVIEDGITIGKSAFKDNEIENLYLPDDLLTINDEVFADNKITELKIPEKVTSIGPNAFSNNVLTTIDIPSTVTSIKSNAFGNNSLTSVIIHGKTTVEDFSEFDYSAFGFMIGYNTKNITFVE